MAKSAILDRVLRDIPGLAEVEEDLLGGRQLEELPSTEEDRKELTEYLEALKASNFDQSVPMPFGLARELLPGLVKEMRPVSGHLTLATIIQGLSFRLNKTYRQVYQLLGVEDATEAQNLKSLLEIKEKNADAVGKGIGPLKKIKAFLKLDEMEMERVLYASYSALFPKPIGMAAYGVWGNETYEHDSKVCKEALELTREIMQKL